jgi:hypothetical protein
MWVDDTAQMERTMKKSFPSLKTILEDATHGMRRYARTLPDGHHGTKAFMGDLSRAFFEVVESDKEQLKKKLMEEERWGAPGTPMRAAAEKTLRSKCRHYIPSPKELRKRVEKVVNDHAAVEDPITGRLLFTPESFNVHNSILALIDSGKFSDPLPVDQMFLRLNSGKEDKFIGLRGTSKLEGFHCHVAKVLQGNRCSAELAGAMMADFTHAWNINRAITNIQGTEDYGCYDTMLLERINGLCKELELPPQFPKLKATPTLKKIPPMFTLAVPPELVPVLCAPEGGIPPLNGAVVEGDDACIAINEFENQPPQLLLPAKNLGARATAPPVPPAAAGVAAAPAAAVDDSQTVNMLGTAVQPLPSLLVERQEGQEEQQRPVLQGIVAQVQQQTLQQEEDLPEAMLASPAADDDNNPSPCARPSSRQGKRSRGRPPKDKAGPTPTKRKRDESLPASPTSAATFSSSPSTVRRSNRAKRAAMPVDYTRSVATEEEMELMLETIGDALASSALRSPKVQQKIATEFNATVLKKSKEDPQSTAGMSFKLAKHVKEFAQLQAESLAVTATNGQVLSNQQREQPTTVAQPTQVPQQSFNLNAEVDIGMMASQQPGINVSQQLGAMQQQQQWWPPRMPPPSALPPQPAPTQYYPGPMHPPQPLPYPGYGMYQSLDPAALVQAAAALLQVQQQQQQPLLGVGGKGSGKGAPGKPRNCGKCGNPLKGKDREVGACFCKSKAVQQAR